MEAVERSRNPSDPIKREHAVRMLPALRWNGPLAVLAFGVFLGATVIATAVQLAILPHLFPGLDGGNGLLIATDSIEFHGEAVRVTEAIRREGWDAWRPFPDGQFMIGLIAAVYALTTPEPWVMIPLSAAAHAIGGTLLALLMMTLVRDWRIAATAASPFVLFPSAMAWYTQLLKDGYFIVGALLFLLGWVLMAQPRTWRGSARLPSGAALSIIVGFLLMGMVRNYALTLMFLTAFIMAALALLFLAWEIRVRSLRWRAAFAAFPVVVVVIIALYGSKLTLFTAEMVAPGDADLSAHVYRSKEWSSDIRLPQWIEGRLRTLAGVRQAYIDEIYPLPPGSNIDTDVRLESPAQIVRYIPRALQVGFLSPFPHHWVEEGTTKATTIMRRVTMLEMLVVYAALLFVPLAIWRWRRSGALWMVLAFGAIQIVIFAIAMPNLGTLYRVRYGFLMPVVSLGLLAALTAWLELREKISTANREP